MAPRWQARLLVLFLAFASVASSACAIAYYTIAGHKQSLTRHPETKPTRLADATDAWLESIRKPSFWRKNSEGVGNSRRQTRQRNRSGRERTRYEQAIPSRSIHEDAGPPHETFRYNSWSRHEAATYRTMCVRLCDGYYWPVSFSATRGEFARDSAVCQRSCDSPAVLHVYRNPGEEPEHMVDLKGNPYAQLPTAFQYRVRYDAACKCRPHPWEDAARNRHASYRQSGEAHASVEKTQ